MQDGFVMIPRSFFESGYWRQSRTFNDCEALLDIISQVRFEASEHFARIGGREVRWGQAEWPASVRFLAKRWHWTERKTRTFLSSLKQNGIITTDDSQGVNIIHLTKYFRNDTVNDTVNDTLNRLNMSELVDLVTQQVTQQVTQRMTQQRHSDDTKHNNGNNIIDSSLRSESILFEDEYSFDKFWDLYDKKTGKGKAENLYKRLSLRDRKAIFEYLPKYKLSQPDKQYRKNPETFLRNRSWEDELIDRIGYGTTTTNQGTYQSSEHPTDSELREQSIRIMQRIEAESANGGAEVWEEERLPF